MKKVYQHIKIKLLDQALGLISIENQYSFIPLDIFRFDYVVWNADGTLLKDSFSLSLGPGGENRISDRMAQYNQQ